MSEQPPLYQPDCWARSLNCPVAVLEPPGGLVACILQPGMLRLTYTVGETEVQVSTYAGEMQPWQAEELIRGQVAERMVGRVCEWQPVMSGQLLLNGLERTGVITARLVSERFYKEHLFVTGKALVLHGRTILVVAQEPHASELALVDEVL